MFLKYFKHPLITTKSWIMWQVQVSLNVTACTGTCERVQCYNFILSRVSFLQLRYMLVNLNIISSITTPANRSQSLTWQQRGTDSIVIIRREFNTSIYLQFREISFLRDRKVDKYRIDKLSGWLTFL